MNPFWTGVLLAMLVGSVSPGWAKAIITVVAAVLSGVFVRLQAHEPHHLHVMVSPWVFAVGGVAFGFWAWHHARLRGLQHLGTAELRTRWTNVRRVSRWGL